MALREFVSGFRSGFHAFGNGVAMVVNTILLGAVYFLAVGLTSLFARLMKKEFLDVSMPDRKSYWEELNLEKSDDEDYYRQF